MTFGPDRLSTSFRDLLRPFGEGFYGVDIKQTDGRFTVSDDEDEIRSALTRTTGRARRAGARYPVYEAHGAVPRPAILGEGTAGQLVYSSDLRPPWGVARADR
jgi:hypothetical protein